MSDMVLGVSLVYFGVLMGYSLRSMEAWKGDIPARKRLRVWFDEHRAALRVVGDLLSTVGVALWVGLVVTFFDNVDEVAERTDQLVGVTLAAMAAATALTALGTVLRADDVSSKELGMVVAGVAVTVVLVWVGIPLLLLQQF